MYKTLLGNKIDRVHFIGIGGISMSGLAEMLRQNGYEVSGSDSSETDVVKSLRDSGIPVAFGNSADNIPKGVDLVVRTAAVKDSNPEYAEAVSRGIETIDRAELLARITEGYPRSVCVAGTHGKTSTTALAAEMFLYAGFDPSISVGGYMGDGYNFKIGSSKYFIMEADEYSDSFLKCKPHIGVILNVDADHMDYFGSVDNLIGSFVKFASSVSDEGALVINAETYGFERITERLKCKVVTYGKNKGDYTARNVSLNESGNPSFDISVSGEFLTRASLRLTGEHHVQNALAVAAVGSLSGMDADTIAGGLSSARGVKRRFEYRGTVRGATVIDDYAHHPTEIIATIKAARNILREGGRLICAFQPHTYSRTKNLMEEFAGAFYGADSVVLLPIFASREQYDGSVTSEDLCDRLSSGGLNAYHAGGFGEASEKIKSDARSGDIIMVMGAGDIVDMTDILLCE